ncbi:MAG: DnaB-like helicase C-terminal domain-containing protein [Desulfatiglandales bacterium]
MRKRGKRAAHQDSTVCSNECSPYWGCGTSAKLDEGPGRELQAADALRNLRRGELAKQRALAALNELNDYIHFIVPDEELMTVDTILDKARIAIFRYGVKGIVIDPWNEVEHQFNGLREDQYISLQLTKIRQFARKNGVHVWVVAHPRNLHKDDFGNYKPPTMYEISGGAHWRNKADNGICIHRPDYQTDKAKIYVQKIRFREIGKIGEATLKYMHATGRYDDL